MGKVDQIKHIRKFRDSLKKYKTICEEFWIAHREHRNVEKSVAIKEAKMRELLTEMWGRLEQLFHRINAPTSTLHPGIGIVRPIFDDALSSDFDGGVKGMQLESAIGSATKAIGLLDALSESQYKGIYRSTPNIFVAHSFKDEHRNLIDEVKKFISSYPVSITTGEKPTLTGVVKGIPEKVKRLIDDAQLVIAILSKDEIIADGKMIPSKWVSDEIPYALGKGKTVIRFQEDGVEFKPTISGDAEYVPFSKENLSTAFIKLSELLNSFLKN
jgi:hypothetical protein